MFLPSQLSNDISANLKMAKKFYTEAEFHIALVTDTLFTRAWCLWEIAIRYQSGKDTCFLRSQNTRLMQRPVSDGCFFESMNVSNKSDRKTIMDEILVTYTTSQRFNVSMKYVLRAAGGKVAVS